MRQIKELKPPFKTVWFRKETDLIDSLLENIRYVSGPNRVCYTKREVPVGPIIPDIVMVSVVKKMRRDLWPYRWTFIHASLVWQLRCRAKLTRESLARRVFENPKRLDPLLTELLKTGAVVKTQSGCFQLGRELRELSVDVISIEAKLKRWKDAVMQAISYSNFSDKSVVAMAPDGIPKTMKSKEIFLQSGIGLISVNGGSPQTIFPGRRSHRNSAEREYLIGSALGRLGQTRWSVL